jgi:hypothetical protein
MVGRPAGAGGGRWRPAAADKFFGDRQAQGACWDYFESRKNHTIFAFCSHSYHDENPFNLSNGEFFFIVRLKGFLHVFAKKDGNNEKIIKEGAKNAVNLKKLSNNVGTILGRALVQILRT